MSDPLVYFQGDELPEWEAVVSVQGELPDYTSGWSFAVTLTKGSATAEIAPTVTGAADGLVTVAWAVADLDIAVGLWVAQLTVTRLIDNRQVTAEQPIRIKPRALEEA